MRSAALAATLARSCAGRWLDNRAEIDEIRRLSAAAAAGGAFPTPAPAPPVAVLASLQVLGDGTLLGCDGRRVVGDRA